MTKLITIILLVCTISVQAQTENLDKKLLAKYSKKELTSLKENPTEYNFAKYCVNNAFYIAPSSKEKIAYNAEKYGSIKIKNISNVNFFELNINLLKNKNQVFVINNSSKVLVVKSEEQIIREIKK